MRSNPTKIICLSLPLLVAVWSGCAASDELTDQASAVGPASGYYESGGSTQAFNLVRTADNVGLVQLYPTGNEDTLPFVSMGSGQTLTLSFDVFEEGSGQPLSVYFYHADREWNRDLLPAEFMTSFLSDDIRNYQISTATEVPYVHYNYVFPNANIDFRVSGNYVIRVARQGYEDEPLFERAFFVSEDVAEIEFDFRSGLSPNGSLLQPIARVSKGPELADAQGFDFSACFARNGRFEQANCTQDPSLLDLLFLQFELPRTSSFPPSEPLYEMNMGLLQTNSQIVNVDLSASPHQADLDLDYARFGSEYDRGAISGQPVVSEVYLDGGNPDTQAEYVDVLFRFVSEGEHTLAGGVTLSGSFNNWQIDPAFSLDWNADEGYYVGNFLLKQGMYLYRYYTEDVDARYARSSINQPSLFTALVYLFEPRLNTERLVAFRSAIAR